MFENWPEPSVGPSPRRVVQPPVPVTVDLGLAIFTDGTHFGANELPLWVRSGGLLVTGRSPGLLLAWARTSSGDWLALVELTLLTANGFGHVPTRQWCTRRAVEKADADH
ncbi:hypothetical protein ACWDOP_01765 [Nocardia sp. NPDC003693]